MGEPVIDPADHTGLIDIVWKIVGRPVPAEWDDDAQAAMLGLCDAARLYDQDKGFKFSTYAVTAMRRRVSHERASRARWRRLQPPHTDRPSRRWLVLFSEIGEGFVRGRSHVFATVGDHEPEATERLDARGVVDEAEKAVMSKSGGRRVLDVLRRRFGLPPYAEPQTLKDVGKAYGLTIERVRQLESRAVRQMRDVITEPT